MKRVAAEALAQRSAHAAQEIGQIVQDSRGLILGGRKLALGAGQMAGETLTVVSEAAGMIREVSVTAASSRRHSRSCARRSTNSSRRASRTFPWWPSWGRRPTSCPRTAWNFSSRWTASTTRSKRRPRSSAGRWPGSDGVWYARQRRLAGGLGPHPRLTGFEAILWRSGAPLPWPSWTRCRSRSGRAIILRRACGPSRRAARSAPSPLPATMSSEAPTTLLNCLRAADRGGAFHLHGAGCSVDLQRLSLYRALRDDPAVLAGRSVLLHTEHPLAAAVGLVELDGLARRIVLCPPGVDPEHLPQIAATAEVEAIVGDAAQAPAGLEALPRHRLDPERLGPPRGQAAVAVPASEWILLTSGTSGVPKLVMHTLQTLCGAIAPAGPLSDARIWSTFYDIRRYGGLQILLRALAGGASLVLADPDEPLDDFLLRAVGHEITHITGTPSHWRRALMNPAALRLRPQYARMSGEIADQAILDRVQASFPQARVAHAYASTEAGVGFEVDDGREGFPAAWVGREDGPVSMRVQDDTLRIRSARTALRYLGQQSVALHDAEGFVDTGDVVQLRGDRYYFAGRRGGIINVGGLKVHPEEIESVINRHPGVRMSLVKARRNPITGSIVVAEVVPARASGAALSSEDEARLKSEILEQCRASLAAYKVPAMVRVVPSIEVTASGKVTRAEP